MRHYFVPTNGIQWLTLFLVPIMVVAIVLGVRRLDSVTAHQNDALHSIICRAEHFARVNSSVTPHQRHQAIRFYDNALKAAHLPPCH